MKPALPLDLVAHALIDYVVKSNYTTTLGDLLTSDTMVKIEAVQPPVVVDAVLKLSELP